MAQAIDRALGPSKVEPALLKAHQAAEYMAMSEEWIRQRARDGTLPSVKIGTATRFRKQDLDSFIESCAREA
jgi:excisionase family DNA binding protein